jgi:aspartyl-tRNA(Asn)/glutamyl-tRNA(Gln) amidotransferase subunit B
LADFDVTKWEPVIGLECHVQLLTASKLFSWAPASFGAPPNTNVEPVSLGMPGVLPVLNRKVIDYAVRLGLATGCTIRKSSRFSRKQYFYPDLPKGYQISQYDEPLCEAGVVRFTFEGAPRDVRLNRIHVEEDAGKNVHTAGSLSLVDYNRACVPLVEVVSEPDVRSASEAAEYLRALRRLVRWLGISDGNLEEGSLRCDANVSVRPRGQAALATRTETKNINSFKNVEAAIEYEIVRQIRLYERGERIVQETRLWDAERGSSHSMRSKEEAHDYRYFPDPDLPPVTLDQAFLDRAREALPELPPARRDRFVRDLELSGKDADVLTEERALADYFEAVVRAGANAKRASNWIQSELLRELNREGRGPADSPVGPGALAELLVLIDSGAINGKIGKDVFAKMYASGRRAQEIVAAEGLTQVSDTGEIEAACRKVVADNPKEVARVRDNPKLIGFFVGQVMKLTGGKANPALVNETLKKILEE